MAVLVTLVLGAIAGADMCAIVCAKLYRTRYDTLIRDNNRMRSEIAEQSSTIMNLTSELVDLRGYYNIGEDDLR